MARARGKPAFDVNALKASLGKGAPEAVYALAGGETFFRSEAIHLLRDKVLGKKDPGLGLLEFERDADPREVLDNLRTRGLFGDARLVIVEPADTFVSRHAGPLARYVASPSDGACLVLVVDSWSPKAALAKAAEGVKVVSCQALRGRAVNSWLKARARHHGKRLEPAVDDMLVETAGADLSVLDRHLENLATYVADRPTVSAEDVADLVGGDPQRATWELVKAVVKGETATALRTLEQMLRHGAVVGMILGGLTAEFSRLWQIKRMMRDGADDDEMLAAVGRHYRFRLPHMKREARELPARRLVAAHPTLLEFDLAAKTSAMPDDLLLECLVIKLCGS